MHDSVPHYEKESTGQRALLASCFSVLMDYTFNRFLLYSPTIPLSREAYFNQIDHNFTCFSKSNHLCTREVFMGYEGALRGAKYQHSCKIKLITCWEQGFLFTSFD